MQPRIGITPAVQDTAHLMIHQGYMEGILQAGGIPLLLPLTDDSDTLDACIDSCDGILFSGGADIDPKYYGEAKHEGCGDILPQRDSMELTLMHRLIERGNKTIFAVCRGIQVLNVALGGTLWQDLPEELGTAVQHRQVTDGTQPVHSVQIEPETPLAALAETQTLSVNSLHHQGIQKPGIGLRVNARSEDGLVEAVDLPGRPFCMGVQWHPERMLWHPVSRALFRAFVRASYT